MSRFLAYIPEAFESIWRHRSRSALSALGMIIGIASVIAVLGLSQAASGGMKEEIARGGDPGFIAVADPSQDNPALATLYYRDAALMQAYASDQIRRAIPVYSSQGSQPRTYRVTVNGHSDFVQVNSTGGELNEANGFNADSGRLIDSDDVLSGSSVGMLSHEAAAKLFPGGGAVGRSINVGSQRLTIVGVFSLKASLFSGFVGETIYLPYTTMHRLAPGPIDFVQFWGYSRSQNPVTVITAATAALDRIHPRAQYRVQDQLAVSGIFVNVLSFIGVGLTFIGGVSLFVAGIGIMNIMLVSVSERTREIGIRKAIGASAHEIATQFLVEATLLSLGGGIIGSILGVLAVLLMRPAIIKSVGAAPVPWGIVIAVAAGFSISVGVGFGSYPAARAGRLDPVEALRG